MFNHINGNLYHYAGNNPVRYVDPDGKSALGKITGVACYLGAAVVIAAGTGLAVTTMGTAVPIVAANTLALAGKLVAAGTAIILVDYVTEKTAQNASKPSPVVEHGATSVASSPSPIPPDNNDWNNDKPNEKYDNSKHREKTRGANANDRKQVDSVAKKFKINRREFGNFIEETKQNLGRGSSDNFTYHELEELAKEFMELQ